MQLTVSASVATAAACCAFQMLCDNKLIYRPGGKVDGSSSEGEEDGGQDGW